MAVTGRFIGKSPLTAHGGTRLGRPDHRRQNHKCTGCGPGFLFPAYHRVSSGFGYTRADRLSAVLPVAHWAFLDTGTVPGSIIAHP